MTSRVILQPAGDSDAMGHFVDTIEIPVEVSRIKSFLSPNEMEELGEIFEGRTSIPVWGVTPGNDGGNARKWGKIESGDVTLFSRKGRIFASATVVAKIHNKSLALDLWDTNSEGETWEYVYFLDELTEQNIPYSAFNEAVGYKPNFVIQGFNVLDETKSDLLLNAFDLRSSVYFPDIPVQDYYTAVTTLDEANNLDSVVMGKGRVEQQFLRKSLLGKRSVAECCLCGRILPVSLLWAAHIKKRSACSLEEKKDFKNIVAPMCKLGCDELYEKKYVSVDSNGIIVASIKGSSSPALKQFIDNLVGKKCSSWNENNKKYFAWHHDL